MQKVTGNTYPVKDQLKSLGGKWNPDEKVWMVPDNQINRANEIVKNAPQAKKEFTCTTCTDAIAGVCSTCGYKCKYPYTECWGCREERGMGY